MSPRALMQRLKQCGVQWLAITDHNSMANCAAYEKVAHEEGLYFSWGVEIQTAEEIHILAYWDDSEHAKAFDELLYSSLLPLSNDPDFFGDQVIIDENENILRVEQRALINSSQWDLNTVVERIEAMAGFAVPAHIDASVNSIISQLGFIPQEPVFKVFGVTATANAEVLMQQYPLLGDKSLIRASDAHYLSDIGKGYSDVFLVVPSISELSLAAQRAAGRQIRI